MRPLIALGLMLPQAGGATQTAADLVRGDEIRVLAPRIESDMIQGMLVSLPGSVVVMQVVSGTTTVPLDAILRLDVRARRRPVIKGTLAFGISGTITGLLALPLVRGLLCAYPRCEPLGFGRAALFVGSATAIGAASGTFLALAWNASRPWYPVALPRGDPGGRGVVLPLVLLRF